MAAALDAQQQPPVTGETHSRGDVLGGGRLDHDGGRGRDHAIPQQYGVVPALVAGAEQRALELCGQHVEPRRIGIHASLRSGKIDGVGAHCADLLRSRAAPVLRR